MILVNTDLSWPLKSLKKSSYTDIKRLYIDMNDRLGSVCFKIQQGLTIWLQWVLWQGYRQDAVGNF